jgi:hypothetical protein
MMMRVSRQAAVGELDVPAIEEPAAWRESDEHRRVGVLGNADRRGSLRSSCRHIRILQVAYEMLGYFARLAVITVRLDVGSRACVMM